MIAPSLATYPNIAHNNSVKTVGVAAHAGVSPGSRSGDVVDFSASARAASGGEKLSVRNPALFASEEQVQIKSNLTRIFMEVLFGEDENAEESAEDELVRVVVEEPLTDS